MFMGTKDLRACWELTATYARPSDARIATTASLLIGVLFCCAQRLQISRTLSELHWIRRRRRTTALLPASALPKSSAWPSDARPAITASRFTGVLLCCALCLPPAEPHGVRRCRQNDHAARCSRAPRQLQLRALDLLSSPC